MILAPPRSRSGSPPPSALPFANVACSLFFVLAKDTFAQLLPLFLPRLYFPQGLEAGEEVLVLAGPAELGELPSGRSAGGVFRMVKSRD